METMIPPETTHDTESIDHLDFEVPCPTCEFWIEMKIYDWHVVLPARWTGLMTQHGCTRARKPLCDYHAKFRPYRCYRCGSRDQYYEQLEPI